MKAGQIINSIARSTQQFGERLAKSYRVMARVGRKSFSGGTKIIGVVRYVDGSTQTLDNPGDPEWSDDGRFATITHDYGKVTINHETFGSFEIVTFQPHGKSRVVFGGY